MITDRKSSVTMLVLLVAMIIIYHVGILIYFVLDAEPLPAFEFLYTFGFICGIVWFLKAEADRSAAARAYCPGITIGMAWMVLLPYHLLKSRGLRGFIPLSLIIGTYLALQVLAGIVYAIHTGAFQ